MTQTGLLIACGIAVIEDGIRKVDVWTAGRKISIADATRSGSSSAQAPSPMDRRRGCISTAFRRARTIWISKFRALTLRASCCGNWPTTPICTKPRVSLIRVAGE